MADQNRTGLEWMQALMHGDMAEPAMSDTIPMKLIAAEKGKVTFEVKADKRHGNIFGGVHGGFAASVLDSATGSAVHTMLDAGQHYATVDLQIKMCRPLPMDTALITQATVINVSRSLGMAEATLKDANNKIYAFASATCMILPKNI